MPKNPLNYVFTGLKGMAMGAADVVPGVSGGTIAFISGIYEELINTIDNLDFKILGVIKREGLMAAIRQYNLLFLGTLLLGIGVSILSFAKIITLLLENEPISIWSFFFGLVIASILYVGGQISKWDAKQVVGLVLGIVVSYYITIAEPVSSPDSYWFLFLSGFIAIIAMILPGISGSFILLLMGSYHAVIGSINELTSGIFGFNTDMLTTAFLKLGAFGIGAVLGVKVFSKALTWLFQTHKNLTLALLTGFMVGSLNKIWPWKETLTTYINSHGEEAPILQRSILPRAFEGDPEVFNAVLFASIGFLTIFLLERFADKKKGTL